ncbi:MAG: hypothetical protein RMK01_13120 [Thermomicrobium sp.]|nr:hypothetical protein [Thermomicrobium sp.]
MAFDRPGTMLPVLQELAARVQRTISSPVRFACLVGSLATVVSLVGLHQRGGYAGDFTWAWRAARLLAQGQNPYRDPALDPIFPYPFDAPLLYPLTAVVVAAPFAALPAWLAGALFFGASSALLAYSIARTQRWHLVPLFLSAPFYVAATVAQWSPLVVVGALVPGLAFLALAKPNIGIPAVLSFGDRESWKRAVAFSLLTLPLLPLWPLYWWQNLRSEHGYPIPLLVFPGFLVLAALLRWSDRRARFLVCLACVPQRLWFYDQLPLWLVARTWRESLLLTATSWVGYWGWRLSSESPVWNGSNPADAPVWVVTSAYLVALALVLRPSLSRWASARRGWPQLRSAPAPTRMPPRTGR